MRETTFIIAIDRKTDEAYLFTTITGAISFTKDTKYALKNNTSDNFKYYQTPARKNYGKFRPGNAKNLLK